MAAAAQTTALVPQNPEPPSPPPNPEPPAWLKPLLLISGAVLAVGGIIWAARRYVANKDMKALPAARANPSPALPAASVMASSPVAIPRRHAAVTRPAEHPWDELERLMAVAPRPQPIQTEGDGETAAGIHYVWRVYSTDPTVSTSQAIAMVQDAEGSWSYWGNDPGSPSFVIAPNVEEAMDRVRDWAEAN